MTSILPFAQIIVSLLLVGAILLQARGTGLSSAFGGESTFYHTRRGLEKLIFWITVSLAVVFIALNIASFISI